MCMQFAQLECKLGEVDRARAIWMHCSQMCDPRTQPQFWSAWKEFEVSHGNTDTAREMLRIKRSVQATFNTQVRKIFLQMQLCLELEVPVALSLLFTLIKHAVDIVEHLDLEL